MQLAPLQLVDYFVHSIQVEALESYDSSKKQDLDIDSLRVTEKCFPLGEDKRFAVDLVIKQGAVEGKNLPYAYELHIVGFVEADPKFPAEKLTRAIETNGPSMLFGAAREILRTATGRGPYGPLLIPSTTFFKPPSRATSKKAASKTAKQATKKTAKKKTT